MSSSHLNTTTTISHNPVKLRPPATTDLAPCAIAEEFQFLKSAHTTPSKYSIKFRHPAYPPENNVLLTLHAWDHIDGGIHHGLAQNACAIIADNRFDGFLSTSTHTNSNPIEMAWDDILPANICDYYFHVPFRETELFSVPTHLDEYPLSPYKWPVVPSFQDWRFPSALPQCWARCNETQGSSPNVAPQSNFTAAIRQRDIQCQITGFQNGTEVAHLVPALEKQWFLSNSMETWNNDTSLDCDSLMKDLSNAVLLRSDIHTAFHERKFVFFPKEDSGFALHMLLPTSDIGPLYHNRRLVIPECNIAFLFTRFAWSIFPSLSAFLLRPAGDRLVVRVDAWTGERITGEAPVAPPSETTSGSRSTSPTKRSRAASTVDGGVDWRTQKRQRLSDSLQARVPDLQGGNSTQFLTHQTERNLAHLSDEHRPRHNEENTGRNDNPEHGDVATLIDKKSAPQPLPNSIHGQDKRNFQHLCKTHLQKQRPESYLPPSSSYDRHRPAKEQLELMGVEILADSFFEENKETKYNK